MPRCRADSTNPAAAIVLPGGRRVAEAVAPRRARILAGERRLFGVDVDDAGVEVVVLLVELDRLAVGGLDARAVPVPVAVLLGVALIRGDQLGQHSGERIDLVAPEIGSRLPSAASAPRARARGRASGRSAPSSRLDGVRLPASISATRVVECAAGARCRERGRQRGPRRRAGTARRTRPERGARRPRKPSAGSDDGCVGLKSVSCICAAHDCRCCIP